MDSKTDEYFSSARKEIEPLLPKSASCVLEIGCGSGATLRWLRTIRIVDYAYGVEIVPSIAERARSVFDEVFCGNIETTQLTANRKFDLILALDVLEHLVDPWAALRMLANRLQPNGTFIASIPNAAHWNLAAPLFWNGSWDYAHDGILDKTHLRFFTKKSARALFESEGFVIRDMACVKSYPGKTPTQRWLVQKYLGRMIPDRLTDFQFVIRAQSAE
jgi:SAM-dependent methyltransferase